MARLVGDKAVSLVHVQSVRADSGGGGHQGPDRR